MAQPNLFRTCVGCGAAKPKKELLRIVRLQDGRCEIDRPQKIQGRGAYICPAINCARLAQKNRGLNRSFKMEVEERFYDELINQVNIDET